MSLVSTLNNNVIEVQETKDCDLWWVSNNKRDASSCSLSFERICHFPTPPIPHVPASPFWAVQHVTYTNLSHFLNFFLIFFLFFYEGLIMKSGRIVKKELTSFDEATQDGEVQIMSSLIIQLFQSNTIIFKFPNHSKFYSLKIIMSTYSYKIYFKCLFFT